MSGVFRHTGVPPSIQQLSNTIESLGGGGDVRVASLCPIVRIFPVPEAKSNARSCVAHVDESAGVLTLRDPRTPTEVSQELALRTFSVGNLFGPTTRQTEVCSTIGESLTNWLWEGFNASIISYGQQSTGKTHTMHGSKNSTAADIGLLDWVITEIFNRIAKDLRQEYVVAMACWDILGNEVIDLLSPESASIAKKFGPAKSTSASKFVSIEVENPVSARSTLRHARVRSANWTTAMNGQESHFLPNRAHSFVRLTLFCRSLGRVSHLHFVDLVGIKAFSGGISRVNAAFRSKHWSASGSTSNHPDNLLSHGSEYLERERRITNQQLLAFRRVLNELCTAPDTKQIMTSSRDSKLTKFIGPLVSGNSKTYLLATVSMEESYYLETINTLNLVIRSMTIASACSRLVNVNESDLGIHSPQKVLSLDDLENHHEAPSLDALLQEEMMKQELNFPSSHHIKTKENYSTRIPHDKKTVTKASTSESTFGDSFPASHAPHQKGQQQKSVRFQDYEDKTLPQQDQKSFRTKQQLRKQLQSILHALNDGEEFDASQRAEGQYIASTDGADQPDYEDEDDGLLDEDQDEYENLLPGESTHQHSSLTKTVAFDTTKPVGGNRDAIKLTSKSQPSISTKIQKDGSLVSEKVADESTEQGDLTKPWKQLSQVSEASRNYETVLALLQKERSLKEKTQSRVAELEQELLELSTQYEIKMDDQRKENIQLKSKIRMLEQSSPYEEIFSQYESDLKILSEENLAIREEMVALQDRLISLSEMESSTSDENLTKKSPNYASLKKAYGNLQHEVSQLRRENEELKRKRRAFNCQQKIWEQTHKKASKLTKELVAMDEEIDVRRKDHASIQVEYRNLQRLFQRIEADNTNILRRVQILHDEVKAMMDEIDENMSILDIHFRENPDYEKALPKASILKASLELSDRLEKELDQAQSKQTPIAVRLKRDLMSADRELQRLLEKEKEAFSHATAIRRRSVGEKKRLLLILQSLESCCFV
eukprot:TRINITY_DN4576_c0_g1_i2.p1 TRINITY_DN4576_c0_g1~~TRINITY_DN4576_c0_g1_i2.p1  ORF type:complete len:999 (-),score=194.94 TRINITY_DN4576_c0_g1_i2:1917-4913(-)